MPSVLGARCRPGRASAWAPRRLHSRAVRTGGGRERGLRGLGHRSSPEAVASSVCVLVLQPVIDVIKAVVQNAVHCSELRNRHRMEARARHGRDAQRSRIATTPWPPAAQIEISPRAVPAGLSSCASIFASPATMRPPVAANGWPVASELPFTFSFVRSIAPSGPGKPSCVRQYSSSCHAASVHNTCAAKAS